MSRSEKKELLVIVIFSIINAAISIIITGFLGMSNTVVLKTYSVIYGDITWEVIIFMGLSLVFSVIMEYSNTVTKLIYR